MFITPYSKARMYLYTMITCNIVQVNNKRHSSCNKILNLHYTDIKCTNPSCNKTRWQDWNGRYLDYCSRTCRDRHKKYSCKGMNNITLYRGLCNKPLNLTVYAFMHMLIKCLVTLTYICYASITIVEPIQISQIHFLMMLVQFTYGDNCQTVKVVKVIKPGVRGQRPHAPGFLKLLWSVCLSVCVSVCVCLCVRPRGH